MTQEKQIEEMVKIMNETCNVYDEQGNHIRNKCGECDCWSDDNHCCCSYNSKEATALYNAGYRKQEQGEWIEYYDDSIEKIAYKCSLCGCDACYNDMSYCPNCGAKIKGAE